MAEIATIMLGMGGMYLLSNMNDKKENMVPMKKDTGSKLKDTNAHTSISTLLYSCTFIITLVSLAFSLTDNFRRH